MLLRFAKSKHPADANPRRRSDTLTCIRDDGSITASKFRASHDLVHYAVETELDLPGSFYRLVAGGLDIEAFNQPGAAKRLNLPPGAGLTEIIVNLLEIERASFTESDAEAFNSQLRAMCEQLGHAPLVVAAGSLARIRARIDELFRAWSGVAPGGAMELRFPPIPAEVVP